MKFSGFLMMATLASTLSGVEAGKDDNPLFNNPLFKRAREAAAKEASNNQTSANNAAPSTGSASKAPPSGGFLGDLQKKPAFLKQKQNQKNEQTSTSVGSQKPTPSWKNPPSFAGASKVEQEISSQDPQRTLTQGGSVEKDGNEKAGQHPPFNFYEALRKNRDEILKEAAEKDLQNMTKEIVPVGSDALSDVNGWGFLLPFAKGMIESLQRPDLNVEEAVYFDKNKDGSSVSVNNIYFESFTRAYEYLAKDLRQDFEIYQKNLPYLLSSFGIEVDKLKKAFSLYSSEEKENLAKIVRGFLRNLSEKNDEEIWGYAQKTGFLKILGHFREAEISPDDQDLKKEIVIKLKGLLQLERLDMGYEATHKNMLKAMEGQLQDIVFASGQEDGMKFLKQFGLEKESMAGNCYVLMGFFEQIYSMNTLEIKNFLQDFSEINRFDVDLNTRVVEAGYESGLKGFFGLHGSN
jgi:hypothetical protein